MEIRHLKDADINKVMIMIDEAKENMIKKGLHQWEVDGPDEKLLEKYVENKNGYVSEGLNVFGALVKEDIDYKEYFSKDYVVLHTFVVEQSLRGTGLTDEFFYQLEKIAKEMGNKIFALDTHKENKSMLRFIEKHDFKELGPVMVNDTKPRIAFYKEI